MFTQNFNVVKRLVTVAFVFVFSQSVSVADTNNNEQSSLYDRLGGLPAISMVVSDFIDALVPDPEINKNPAVDAARTRVPPAYLKYHVTALVC